MLSIGTTETLRKWVRQAEVDDGARPGTTTEESAELKRLGRENAELRRANEILKAAVGFLAAELDRPHRSSLRFIAEHADRTTVDRLRWGRCGNASIRFE
jgi:transposase